MLLSYAVPRIPNPKLIRWYLQTINDNNYIFDYFANWINLSFLTQIDELENSRFPSYHQEVKRSYKKPIALTLPFGLLYLQSMGHFLNEYFFLLKVLNRLFLYENAWNKNVSAILKSPL